MSPGRYNKGFSLLEMLLVLAVMAILMTTGSMVTTSVYQSSLLSRDIEILANELARASLDSVRTNRPIQIRFYRFRDSMSSQVPLVQAYQMLALDSENSSYRELGKIRFLSQGISILDDLDASTILSLPEFRPVTREGDGTVTDPTLPTIAPYAYYEFEFRPDGSTNLPKDKAWGLVIAFNDETVRNAIPQNYRALGINPFTGAIKHY